MKLSQVTERIYRTKNDIPFLKLKQFGEEIKGQETDIDLIEKKVKEHFNTSDLVGFQKALETNPKKINFTFKVDLDLKKAAKYNDADTFQLENDLDALLRLFVSPKYFSQKIDVHKMKYAECEYIINSFLPAY